MRASAVTAHTFLSISGRSFRFLLIVLFLMSASLSAFAQTLTVSPATLTFANQGVGSTSAAKIVTIKNTGTSAQAVVMAPSGPFTETDTCAGNIASGHSCKMSVYFTPTIAGTVPGAVNINDASNSLLASVSLSGTGVEPVTLSVTSLSFGTVFAGNTSAAKTVTLTNNGQTALTFTSIAPTGDFALASNTCGGSIKGKGKCVVGVTFSPLAVGALTGTLTFTDSASNSPQTVSLGGTGSAPVAIAPTSLTFASRNVGSTSAADTVTLTNHLTTSLTISTIVASGDFSIASNTCGSSVGAGLKCTIGVNFTPTIVGTRTGTLTISFGAFGSPTVVNLTGTGNVKGLTSITVTPANPSIAVGNTQQFVATGQFSNGNTANLTNSVTWSSATPSVATISTTGLASAAGTGQTVIKAASGTINGSTTLSVTGGASYTIGGTISGLTGYGLVLQDNGGNNLPVAAGATAFAFSTPVPSGGSYNVTVLTQPSSPTQTCVVANGSGTANTNVTNIQITCTTTTYTIGGTISGLTGSGLVLQDNGGNNLPVAAGATAFTFSTPVPSGGSYNVTVLTQPSSPTQACVVANGSGTANANVTNVQITCTTTTGSATLNPSSAHQGSAETITITGTGTTFGPTTAVNFGADITTGTVSVNGPTSASVPITIDNVAVIGPRTVTITTGSQVATATFTVVAGVPVVTVISPNMIQPTQTESVAITGAFTNWASGTTTANFGPGIAVGGAAAGTFGPVTVNSATSLTANLVTSGASNGFRSVQIQTGSQTLTVNNGMLVQTCNGTVPAVLNISPFNGATGVPLNALVQVQFSMPMNGSTLSLGTSGSATVFFYDTTTNQEVPGAIALDASGTIATITPSETLPAGRVFSIYLSHTNLAKDACGDSLSAQQFYFTTAFNNDLTGPALTGTSPENGDINIPLNAPIVLQFNDQLDPITAQTGLSMQVGGNAVSGTFTYSTNDQTVTFTPATALTASTNYTVSYSAQITDTVGNALTNPGSFTFTTGTNSITIGPSVTVVDPPNQTVNVGLNVTPHVTFNEPVNELSIPATLSLDYENGSPVVPATVTVAANRLSATITPSAPLLPNTEYGVQICGYTDIAGNSGNCFGSTFVTGSNAVTSHTTVSTVVPANAQTGVPLNPQIVAVMSNTVDPTSLTNSAINVTPSGGSAVAGALSLASDGVTLTFVPSTALTASTVYTISVSGFFDIDGNSVTPFTSTFTTGTASFAAQSFKLSSTSPANKATGVSVTSPVTFTMSNLIDAASVNSQTVEVEVCYDGTPCTNSEFVAGTFAVSGATVTFTPLTQYPASTVIGMYVSGLMDEAGNQVYNPKFGTFTTANTVDTTAPTVTITPANGATNVGLNTQVVLSFSESINTSTISTSSLALFNSDSPIGYNYSISQDNRTIIVTPGGNAWTPGAVINVGLSNAIRDLSGNALANTNSQFTLTTALASSAPTVVAMRPGNGATNVPANTAVTLFTSTAMSPSTINGSLYVTDNGVVVSGAVQLFSNGQAIEFTPASSFNPGDLIQVFLNSTAQSASAVSLSSFSGQFTVAGSPANTAAVAQAVNPFPNATNVPLNTIIQVEFNQPLAAGSINCSGSSGSVTLYQSSTGTYLTPNCTLIGGGQVINIAPSGNLASGSQYQVKVSSSVTNTNGIPVQPFTANFTAGSAADNAAPTITSEAPINNATRIGTNALVSVNFNKAINPVSVTGSTIQLSGNSITEVPSSISFTPDYTRVTIVPQAPLPPSTVMTLAVNGVTSQAGKSVAATTTTFTTAAQPDFTAPYVINSSVQNGQANVPVNSPFSMQFSKAMDIGSFNASNVYVSGGILAQIVPSTVSWSADQTTIFLVPGGPLNVGDSYSLCSASMTDLDGNPQQSFCANFTAAFAANTTPPSVVNTSPENGLTQVATNSPVQVLFSEPIQPTSIGQITLKTGSNAVAVTPSFSDANQLLTLTATQPLAASTGYTISITGVKDTAGNQMTATVTNTFTTGPTFDLNPPSVVLSDPAPNTAGVGTNVAPRVQFSKRLNPLSVVTSSNETYNQGSVQLLNAATGVFVPVTVSMSSDRLTATLTPTSPLMSNTQYELYIGETLNYYDVAGNSGTAYTSNFTTGSGTDSKAATVSTISPVSGQTAVPLNAQIVAVMSDSVDPTTVTNSSITVTPSGGSAIAGTVTLASDGVTLTFVPNANLAKSKVYNVSVGGFNSVENVPVSTFASSFTTGTASYGSASFTLSSTTPASGATSVAVTSPVTFTMSNLIDPATVNNSTVEVCINTCGTEYVAGTYSVSGATVTFTPLTQYPANATIGMYVDGLADVAGNVTSNQNGGSFTTASTVDSTPPTVAITPSNGSANLGLNAQVVLTFSKSINPTTISSSSVNLFNGDTPLNPVITISQDNRTVVLNSDGTTLPAGATITVMASHMITDLSGNALADTTSQFTTTAAVLTSAPSVLSSRPGNGATNVPANIVITLFTSAPMNAGTISGALEVSQNGVLVSGTATVLSNGQTIEFTPSSAFAAGAPIQVFLNSTAQDIYGNNLTNFAETFTTTGSLTNSAAVAQVVNPFPNATNVPLNSVVQVEFNQALQVSTVTCNGSSGSVTLYQNSTATYLTPNCTVVGGGQVINIAPTSNLVSGSTYKVAVTGNVTNIDGIAVQPFSYSFTAGTAVDSAAPTVVSVAPPNSSVNIGTNAPVSVNFNKAINPVSVTGSSIQVSGGSVTEVPSSISFTPDFTRTTIIPQAPLPTSTQMAVAINGVTSEAGVAVASQTTHFTTLAGPDLTAPYVVNASVASNQYVGTNAAFAMQFNKPMDPGSVNPAGAQDVFVYDLTAAANVATAITFSADSTTVMLKPTANLAASHQFQMCANSMTDFSGNTQTNYCVKFYAGTGTDTTGPAVLQVSPPSGFTGVGTNSPVQILFSEPIDGASIGGVTLKQGSSVIPATAALSDGDQRLQLLPLTPLTSNTTYTINVTGVLDITGNAQTSFPSQSFTTGTTADLIQPALSSTNPAGGATSVSVTTGVQAFFNKAMNPASFDPTNSFVMYDSSHNLVPATITFSANYTTATLQPKAYLTGGGALYSVFISYFAPVTDLAGNTAAPTILFFTTQ